MSEARFGWLARTFPIAGTAAALSLCLWTDLAGAQEESDEVPETAPASVDPGAVQEVEVTFSFGAGFCYGLRFCPRGGSRP